MKLLKELDGLAGEQDNDAGYCCYLVLDEADWMIDLGFEEGIGAILTLVYNQCAPPPNFYH